MRKEPHLQKVGWWLLPIGFLITTCTGLETLASYEVSLPASAAERQLITLSVRAVGSRGTKPFTDFAGAVALSVSEGTITPETLDLSDGTGTVGVRLSGIQTTITLRVRGGSGEGSTEIAIEPLKALPGEDGEPANDGIPDIDVEPRGEDFSDDHPDLGGLMISFNTLLITFALDATVAEVNSLLEEFDAEIVGGIPGRAGEAPGILLLRVLTSSHQEMIPVMDAIRDSPKVVAAATDMQLEASMVPQVNGGNPPGWTWGARPGGGNWGLELLRVPQLWNLNEAVLKAIGNGDGARTRIGIIDGGFARAHEDLVYASNSTPATQHFHGTFVAGIVGATFDNGRGIDGLTPFADLDVVATNNFSKQLWILANWDSPRVVNISEGFEYARGGVNPATSIIAQFEANAFGKLFAATLRTFDWLPLIVVPSGNDSNRDFGFGLQEARWASPFANAALVQKVGDILVVEAIASAPDSAGGATRSHFSNVNGHVSAPGSQILSTYYTSGNPTGSYQSSSGTSYSAPHVAALAGYLLSVDPTLSNTELRTLLISSSQAVEGGASDRIDAFEALMDIDLIRDNDRVLTMMLDIDDGTLDGNRRTTPTGNGFTDEDADADGGIGDGSIDMADFRRWRDWNLQLEGSGQGLDGGPNHPKKDVNGNGTVEDPFREGMYPRGDFNGDGALSPTATHLVGGRYAGERTDLELLQILFSDPDYGASELSDLLESWDLEIDPGSCLALGSVNEVRSWVEIQGTGTPLKGKRQHPGGDPEMYTVAASERYSAHVEGLDGQGRVIATAHEGFTFVAGKDELWNPICRENEPPEVDAGSGGTITLPDTAQLSGAVIDDGLPRPPGSVTTSWSKVSGPGTVTFANDDSVSTTASFSEAGTYRLTLSGFDGSLSGSDTVTVTVEEAPSNLPPLVDAGSDQTITLPDTAQLDATVTDDGNPDPPGAVTLSWSKVSGPGIVAFEDPAEEDTTASFSTDGTYVLAVSASDGEESVSDEVSITVNPRELLFDCPDVMQGVDFELYLWAFPGNAYRQVGDAYCGMDRDPGNDRSTHDGLVAEVVGGGFIVYGFSHSVGDYVPVLDMPISDPDCFETTNPEGEPRTAFCGEGTFIMDPTRKQEFWGYWN